MLSLEFRNMRRVKRLSPFFLDIYYIYSKLVIYNNKILVNAKRSIVHATPIYLLFNESKFWFHQKNG